MKVATSGEIMLRLGAPGCLRLTQCNQLDMSFAGVASCLKYIIKGDYNQVSADEVENLIKGNGSGRVKR